MGLGEGHLDRDGTEEMPSVLFCIGAQKSGTTWLFRYLSEHPSVHVPFVKEVHYFEGFFREGMSFTERKRRADLEKLRKSPLSQLKSGLRSLQRKVFPASALTFAARQELELLVAMHEARDSNHELYRQVLMRGYNGQRVVADITPEYAILGAEHFAQMYAAFPNARFLYLMRDPVDRAISAIRMSYRFNQTHSDTVTPADFEADIMSDRVAHRHFFHLSRYPRVLRALEASVPKERIQYIFYEDMFTDRSMRNLCKFLEIPFKKGNYQRAAFRGKGAKLGSEALRTYLQGKLAGVYPQMEKKFGEDLPAAWMTATHGNADVTENTGNRGK